MEVACGGIVDAALPDVTADRAVPMKPPDAVAIRELEFTASSLIIPAFSATVVESVLTL